MPKALSEDHRWLWDTAVLAIAVGILTGLISLVWPKTYKADAKILPNPSSSPSSSLLGLAAASGFGDLLSSSLGAVENPVLTYPEILSSRALLERVALGPYPREPGKLVMQALGIRDLSRQDIDRAVRKLGTVTQVQSNLRSGFVYVSAVTRDSVLSAYIVQQMLTELDHFNVESRSSQGRATREFVEGRLEEARHELASAEQALALFRKTNIRIGNSPQLLLEQARWEREVDTRAELYRLLARQYEMARIEEKRDTPTFAVVDPPTPPVRKYRPMVLFNVFVSMLSMVAIRLVLTRLRAWKGQGQASAPIAAAIG